MPDFLEAFERGFWRPSRSQRNLPLVDSHTPVADHISVRDPALPSLTAAARRRGRRQALQSRIQNTSSGAATPSVTTSNASLSLVGGACSVDSAESSVDVIRDDLQFIGKTVIGEWNEAVRTAVKAVKASNFTGRNYNLHLVFYTAGSRADGGSLSTIAADGGYAVNWKVPMTERDWRIRAFRILDYCYSAVQAELVGQTEAMAMALRYLEGNDVSGALIQIFTGSQESITTINKGVSQEFYTGTFSEDHVRPILVEMPKLSEKIHQRRSSVEIHWMPRQSTFQHKLATRLAVKASLNEDVEITEQCSVTIDLDEEVEDVAEMYLERLLAPSAGEACQGALDPKGE